MIIYTSFIWSIIKPPQTQSFREHFCLQSSMTELLFPDQMAGCLYGFAFPVYHLTTDPLVPFPPLAVHLAAADNPGFIFLHDDILKRPQQML